MCGSCATSKSPVPNTPTVYRVPTPHAEAQMLQRRRVVDAQLRVSNRDDTFSPAIPNVFSALMSDHGFVIAADDCSATVSRRWFDPDCKPARSLESLEVHRTDRAERFVVDGTYECA